MTYVISQEATRDLEAIWLYSKEKWSKEQADNYLNLIFDEIESIAKEPKIGIDYSQIREGYFRSRVKSHFIFYRVNEVQNEIEVIRILHQKMDIETRLEDQFPNNIALERLANKTGVVHTS